MPKIKVLARVVFSKGPSLWLVDGCILLVSSHGLVLCVFVSSPPLLKRTTVILDYGPTHIT